MTKYVNMTNVNITKYVKMTNMLIWQNMSIWQNMLIRQNVNMTRVFQTAMFAKVAE